MKQDPLKQVMQFAEIGEAVVQLVKESGVLAKKRGRKPKRKTDDDAPKKKKKKKHRDETVNDVV